jgi:hypothetical protein
MEAIHRQVARQTVANLVDMHRPDLIAGASCAEARHE